MKTTLCILLILGIGIIGGSARADDSGFTLEKFHEMESQSPDELDLILPAMYQTAVYAQAAIDHPTICFTPIPLPGESLRGMIAAELANPDNALGRAYAGDDPVALVLVNALKAEQVCR